MNHTKTSYELKMAAKDQLLNNYGKMISALLVVDLIPTFILLLASDFLAADTLINTILYYVIYFMVSLLVGIFTLGNVKFYMNFCTGRDFRLSDIFYGFHGHQDVGILLILVNIGITFLSMVPFLISVGAFLFTQSAFLYPVMALTLIAGVLFAYIQLLSLSQCFYIAVDFPDYSVRQILSMSRRIMKGHRARLFYIQVSFLPLALLCMFTMGIGLLWLYPYMNSTLTHFYLDLMDYHARQYH